jgi:DNA-3-methyladenine glycosylase
MIVETEAYGAAHDKASHARSGKTARNAPMFDGPGTIYVYLTYGMHWLLNLVVDKKEYPSAVLIRGLEGVTGPARLTKKLQIGKGLNRKTLGKASGLWVEDRGVVIEKSDIKKTPRVGVDYAGVWAKKPYRFVLKK